MINIRSLLQ